MRDVIWTIIIVWLVYRIYSAFSNRKPFVFQKHEHHHYDKEGTIKVDPTPNKKNQPKKDDGDFTDYEEIK